MTTKESERIDQALSLQKTAFIIRDYFLRENSNEALAYWKTVYDAIMDTASRMIVGIEGPTPKTPKDYDSSLQQAGDLEKMYNELLLDSDLRIKNLDTRLAEAEKLLKASDARLRQCGIVPLDIESYFQKYGGNNG